MKVSKKSSFDFSRLKEKVLKIVIKIFLVLLSLFIGFSCGILVVNGILSLTNMILLAFIIGAFVAVGLSIIFIRWFWEDLQSAF